MIFTFNLLVLYIMWDVPIYAPLEKNGIIVLTNETVNISRNKESLAITGIDDPHYYYTDTASEALNEKIPGFKIVAVHTPELYDIAAENNYDLYLCGHTHGGQVALPGGYPIITHVYTGKRFYRGPWKYRDMRGYTNQGCGVVGIPVRFNTISEIAMLTLQKYPMK